jgi:hypothetical protein
MKISFKNLIQNSNSSIKEQLLLSLRKAIPTMDRFIVSMFRQRRLQINIDANESDSYTKIERDPVVNKFNYLVSIGTNNDGMNFIERWLFDVPNFPVARVFEYKLLHELCICLLDEKLLRGNKYAETLKNLVEKQNGLDQKFFTLHGSFIVSITKSKKLTDDIAELICIYLWGEAYFRKYMKFLINDQNEALKKIYAIRTITINDVAVIEELIKGIIR